MPKSNPSLHGRTDWSKLRALSDAEIEHIASTDADNPPQEGWSNARRGVPSLSEHHTKTAITAKFDADIIKWFKAKGRGYQTRMNDALRLYMEKNQKLT